jgi:glycosyltransferase involved in cell wall biosynthesis
VTLSSPSFSVLITNHNYASYVVRAIQSALSQSLRPREVIVVDDGSTDGSLELLQREFGSSPGVRVVATPNRGQLAAFVAGYEVTSGDVVAFLDADDYWAPEHLQQAAAVFQLKPHIDFIFTNVVLVGSASGTWHKEAADQDVGVRVLQAYHLQPWTGSPTSALLIRRRLCQKLLDVPHEMLPDWKTRADDCLVYGAGILGAHKYYLARPTVNYHVHGANQWYGSSKRGADISYLWRTNALVDFYARKAGLGVLPPMSVILEFKSLERPTVGELWFYLRLLGKLPWGPGMHLRQAAAMCLHFLRVWLRPASK